MSECFNAMLVSSDKLVPIYYDSRRYLYSRGWWGFPGDAVVCNIITSTGGFRVLDSEFIQMYEISADITWPRKV